jgi:hypothetical protein
VLDEVGRGLPPKRAYDQELQLYIGSFQDAFTGWPTTAGRRNAELCPFCAAGLPTFEDERQPLFDGVYNAVRGDSNDGHPHGGQVPQCGNRPYLLSTLRAQEHRLELERVIFS